MFTGKWMWLLVLEFSFLNVSLRERFALALRLGLVCSNPCTFTRSIGLKISMTVSR